MEIDSELIVTCAEEITDAELNLPDPSGENIKNDVVWEVSN